MRARKNKRGKFSLEDQFASRMRVWCRAQGIPEPEREYPFARAIGRRWRFDFAWPDAMLAVEVEGGTASGGRHVEVGGFREDCIKYASALVMGWRVLRGDQVMVSRGWLAQFAQDALLGAQEPTLRGTRKGAPLYPKRLRGPQ